MGREGHLCEGSFIQVVLQGLKVASVPRAIMLGVQCEMGPQNAAPFGQRLLPSDVWFQVCLMGPSHFGTQDHAKGRERADRVDAEGPAGGTILVVAE